MKKLVLPEQVEHLRWLPEGLEDLALPNSLVSSLEGVPKSVKRLDVQNINLTTPSSLPERLDFLDARWVDVSFLTPSSSIRYLRLADIDPNTVYRWTAFLGNLNLLTVEDLASGVLDPRRLPKRIKTVELRGLTLSGLEGFSEELKALLVETRSASGLTDLPSSVSSLHLIGPFESIDSVFPSYLDELKVEQLEGGPWVFPKYLTALSVQSARTGKATIDISRLPLSLERLKLDDVRLLRDQGGFPLALKELMLVGVPTPDEWPERLEVLRLPMWSDEANLKIFPATLRQLDFQWAKVTALPSELPSALRSIDLSGSQIAARELARIERLETLTWRWMPPEVTLPASLRRLDVSCSAPGEWLRDLPGELEYLGLAGVPLEELPQLPTTLKELDLRGTGLRDLTGLAEMSPALESLSITPFSIVSLREVPKTVKTLTFDEAPCKYAR